MIRTISSALLTFVLIALALGGAVVAKPKIPVKIHIDEEITNLDQSNDFSAVGTAHSASQYFNVTVLADSPTESLPKDGKLCLKSQANQLVHLTKDGIYDGDLSGTFIHLQLPQPKGKPVEISFSIFDRKWRSRLDIK